MKKEVSKLVNELNRPTRLEAMHTEHSAEVRLKSSRTYVIHHANICQWLRRGVLAGDTGFRRVSLRTCSLNTMLLRWNNRLLRIVLLTTSSRDLQPPLFSARNNRLPTLSNLWNDIMLLKLLSGWHPTSFPCQAWSWDSEAVATGPWYLWNLGAIRLMELSESALALKHWSSASCGLWNVETCCSVATARYSVETMSCSV